MRSIIVSDRTLCVGTKGAEALTFREKSALAARLCDMGVDAIVLPEIRRPKEETVINRTICASLGEVGVKIAVGNSEDSMRCAWESISGAKNPSLCVVYPVSTVQMEYQYHKKADAMLETIGAAIRAAAVMCPKVEFVAKDASRAEAGFIAKVCAVAKENGATAVVLCDDAGVWMPEDAAKAVEEAKCGIDVYVCPSQLLHMGVAVAVAVLRAGAAGIVTGMGEDGLTPDALADVLRAKGEELGVTTSLRLTEIHRDAEELMKELEEKHSADAKNKKIRLTSDSTLADVTAAVMALGYELTEHDMGRVHGEVRRVTSKKEYVGGKELEAIVATAAMQVPSTYHLESYVCTSGNVTSSMAQITLTQGDEKLSGISTGDGPIDAAFRAIEQILGHHYELDDFQIHAVTEGRGAIGNALVKLRSAGKLYSGNGASTDIIGASIRAYLNALNKIVYEEA